MACFTRLAAAIGLAVAVGWSLPAAASSSDPTPQAASSETVPQAGQSTGSGSSAPLGDRLDRSNGVIRPPGGVDPGLTQPPSESGSNTPVIPPPGTPGGKQGLNPK